MTIFQIRITVSPIPAGFGFTARGFIDSLHGWLAKTCSGSCVGSVEGGVITLEARTTAKEELASLVESYCDARRTEGRTVEIVVVENPVAPLSESAVASGSMLNTAPVKLTRSYFMNLTAGAFLVSNLFKGRSFEPAFAESVESAENRVAQWLRIKAAGADQRASHVFPSEGHYLRWHQQQVEYFSSLPR